MSHKTITESFTLILKHLKIQKILPIFAPQTYAEDDIKRRLGGFK